jgi:hypothetical protein
MDAYATRPLPSGVNGPSGSRGCTSDDSTTCAAPEMCGVFGLGFPGEDRIFSDQLKPERMHSRESGEAMKKSRFNEGQMVKHRARG